MTSWQCRSLHVARNFPRNHTRRKELSKEPSKIKAHLDRSAVLHPRELVSSVSQLNKQKFYIDENHMRSWVRKLRNRGISEAFLACRGAGVEVSEEFWAALCIRASTRVCWGTGAITTVLVALTHRRRQELVEKDYEDALVRTLVASSKESKDPLSPKWVGTTLQCLNRLGVKDPVVIFKLLHEAMPRVEEFDSQSISNTLGALVRSDLNDEACVTRLIAVAITKLGEATSQMISTTIHALGKLKLDEQVLKQYLVAAATRKAEFNAWELTDTLITLSKLNLSDEVLTAFVEEAVEKLPSFTGQQLADVAHALAKRNRQAEVVKICEAALSKIAELNAQDIAHFFSALSKFDIYDEAFIKRLCEEGAKRATEFVPYEITSILKDLVKLGVYDELLMGQLCAAALQKANRFEPMEIRLILQSLWKFGVLEEALVQKLSDVAIAKASEFSIQELTITFNFLTKFAIYNQELVHRFCEAAVVKACDCTGVDISVFLNALAKVDVYHEGLIQAFIAKSKQSADKFKLRHIALTINALASFDVYDEELCTALCKAAKGKLDECLLIDMALLLYGLICLQHFDFELYTSLSKLLHKWPESSAAGESLDRLYLCNLCVSLERPDWPPLAYPSSRSLLEGGSSLTHQRVSAILTKLGVNHENEYNIRGFVVDIAVLERKLVIEVDGPQHFFRDTTRVSGGTLLKHRLLRDLGWDVVSIPFHAWEALPQHERSSYILTLLANNENFN